MCAGMQVGGVMFSTVAVDLFCWDESEQAGSKEVGGGLEMHMREKGVGGGGCRESGLLALEALWVVQGGVSGPEPQCHIPLSG